MNDWVLHASIAVGWLALFVGIALVLAYRRAIGDLVMNPSATRERLTNSICKMQESHNPLGQLQRAPVMPIMAEPLEKRIRVDGVKTGRVTALELPGQFSQALELGVGADAVQ